MGSATTDPSGVSPAPVSTSPVAVPSLNALRELTSEPDRRVVFRGVDWAFYERLVEPIPEGDTLHADYDGRDVEIMSLSPRHDGVKKRLGRFVELTAEELEVPCTGLGQTTWKRPELSRALEADECYYFTPEKLRVVSEAMTRMSANVAEYPNPDLAIEVDISPSKIDRPGIYAALGVAEVWRCDGRLVVIERLGKGGILLPAERSAFLPVRSEDIARWVLAEPQGDGSLWGRLREWVRDLRGG